MASIATTIELYDRVSQPLNAIISAMQSTVNAMAAVNNAFSSGIDTSNINQAAQNVSNAVSQIQNAANSANATTSIAPAVSNPAIPTTTAPVQVPVVPNVPDPLVPNPPPVQVPVEWQADNLEVFTNTGVERFEQELQSANNLMAQLAFNQQWVTQTANSANILPPNAIADISEMSNRIGALQQRLRQLESTPVSLRTTTVNNQIEQIRNNLSQAVNAQNDLNTAIERMDVSSANSAYLRLSQTINNTERQIRNNVDAQRNFNQEVEQGSGGANKLLGMVKGLAAAYLSFQTVKKAMDLSDELVQTTARLDMMNSAFNKINGTANQTNDLVKLVYQSAQNARGSFSDMAAVVAKFGNNARDAFSSQQEVVDFANLVQKQMTIAGASTTEASNAMLQLSQALGSGVLRGDELNSIFEQAPNLIQSIADYMNVDIGQIRAMAKEGKISADVVKQAMFASADDINAKFSQMPMTWSQVWTIMGNAALMTLRPVLTKINELANNAQFQAMLAGLMNGLSVLALGLLNIMELVGNVASFFINNWSVISPIVYGVVIALGAYLAIMGAINAINIAFAAIEAIKATATAIATAAQMGFNAALLACPITWIVAGIAALIAVIALVANHIAKTTGIASTGFGVITGGINVVIQWFRNLGLVVANIALGIGNAIGAVAANIPIAFGNAIAGAQSWFYKLLATAASVIEKIAAALNQLPFISFDYSGITNAANDFAAKSAAAANTKQDYKSISDAFNKGANTFNAFEKGWDKKAFKAGATWGDGVVDNITSKFKLGDKDVDTAHMFNGGGYEAGNYAGGGGYSPDTSKNIKDTAGNTARMADTLTATAEEIKYLRDIAERDTINRFTTAEIKVEMNNTNNISNTNDLDGIINSLAVGVLEAMEQSAEGVHV